MAAGDIESAREEPAATPFEYDGWVYVRPVGRGIVLLDVDGEPYLEDLPHGRYRARIRLDPLKDDG
jgi:hypothetical protein